MTSRPSTAAPILAVLTVVLVMLLSAYVGGYVALGTLWDIPPDETDWSVAPVRIRWYDHKWMVSSFEPAAVVESGLTGNHVIVAQNPE